MNYVGKIFTWGKDLYRDLNAATLTGAIDVIVVEQPDGSLTCSPFHVRFGKLGVLRSKEKEVDIFVNNEPVQLKMKLGDSGVAYFVEEEEAETTTALNDDDRLLVKKPSSSSLGSVTSLLEREHDVSGGHIQQGPSSMSVYSGSWRKLSSSDSEISFKSAAPGAVFADPAEGAASEGGGLSHVASSANLRDSLAGDVGCHRSSSNHEISASQECSQDDMQALVSLYGLNMNNPLPHPFSDGDITPPEHRCGSPLKTPHGMSALSDSELSCSKHHHAANHQQLSWPWGHLPTMEFVNVRPHQHPDDRPGGNVVKAAANQDEQPTEARSGEQGSFFGSVMQRLWPKGQAHQHQDDGDIYLSELNLDDIDQEMATRYLGQRQLLSTSSDLPLFPDKQSTSTADFADTRDSGTVSMSMSSPDTGSVMSEHRTASELLHTPPEMPPGGLCAEVHRLLEHGNVELSLCGNLKNTTGDTAPEKFQDYRVTFDAFCEKPDLFSNPHLVVRIGEKYYSWQVAAAVIMSLLVFQQPLPEKPLHSLMKRHMPKKRRFAWFSWRGGEERQPTNNHGNSESMSELDSIEKVDDRTIRRWHAPNSFSSDDDIASADEIVAQSDEESVLVRQKPARTSSGRRSRTSSNAQTFDPWQQTLEVSKGEGRQEKRTLRLSSEKLRQLRLQPGKNSISFSVTTKYQGTAVTTAMIYLWHHNDKVVVSDVDGTITKSDVYGHILPWFGHDWTHTGVAELFSAIEHNGYRFVYLSARAIGQAHITRQYLRNIKQGSLSLPEGPVLLNPSSLIHAFHREVILKKPEEFKIAALRDIAAVFGSTTCPYHAGFGNRLTDVITYGTVGIPHSRIFTVDPRGSLTHDLMYTFQSTYNNLRTLTDQFFPPVHMTESPTTPEAFSYFNFWRPLLPDLDELESSLRTN